MTFNIGRHAFAASVRVFRLLKLPRKHENLARTHAFTGLGPSEISRLARESMAPHLLLMEQGNENRFPPKNGTDTLIWRRSNFDKDAIMRIRYDTKVDALSIIFRDASVTTRELTEGIAGENDDQDRLVGLEILDAAKRFGDPSTFQQIILEGIGPALPAAALAP